jgi:glutamine amidotransferase
VIAIVDYRAGNLVSVKLALDDLGVPAEITQDPRTIREADRVIFPGVGAAGSSMRHLAELELAEPLREAVAQGAPFLGICMGMQACFEHSEEDGGVDCLGLLPGNVRRFQTDDPLCKIPQMGWNTVEFVREHPVFAGIENASEFYFVHSYYADPGDDSVLIGATEYAGVRFAAAAGRANIVATQFHPERSGRIGLRLLENFAKWDGQC